MMYNPPLRLYMATKLFGAIWMRQTKQAITSLEDADVAFDYIDVGNEPHLASALTTILGDYNLPVLIVDGQAYKGGARVNEYLKNRTS